AERRMERELRDAYLAAIPRIAAGLDERSLPDAVALAEEALQVRGFGPVKAPAADALLRKLRALNDGGDVQARS
ncbi:MAG TPA: DUF6537 domain-containing protein, partial [Sphingomonadales bacterium]